MEQPLDPLKLIKNETLEREARALYTFFTEAESTGTHFTYADIDNHSTRRPGTIRRYARNYWSWFLRKEPEKRGRSAMFSCQGLKGYPEFYFVMAHQYNQGQHYRHFYEALHEARERAEARRAKLEGTPTTSFSSSLSPDVPGQSLPEALHIEELPPDDEIEEDELETEQPQDLNEVTQQEGNDGTTSESAHKERINVMSIFSLDKQLAQIRTEFTQKLDALEHSVAEGRAESTSSTQALEQTLTEEIQGLPVPLNQTFATRIQALEQSIAAERDQMRSEWTSRMQVMENTILERIQQLSSSLDFSQVRIEFTDSLKTLEQTLLREIQQLHVSSEVSLILEKLEQLQKQAQDLSLLASQPSPISENIEQLQKQVSDLWSLEPQLSLVPESLERLQEQVTNVSSLVSQRSLATGQDAHIIIERCIQLALDAIDTLKQELTSLLKDLEDAFVETGQYDEAENQASQQRRLSFSKARERLRPSATNGEKDQQADQ